MKTNFSKRAALIATLFVAVGSFAVAAEPMDGDEAGYSPSQSTPKPRGLLVDYFIAGKSQSGSGNMDLPASDRAVGSGVPRASLASMSTSNNWDMVGPQSNMQVPAVSDCVSCSDCDCCPDPLWVHRSGVFADFLYLRPGNIDYIYAVEQTGTLPTDSQTGPTGRVGFDASPGYRVGLTHCLTECSSIQASYTWFQDDTQSSITATPGTVLIFQPGLPSIPNVGASSIQASANYNIRFQQADIDYRGLLYGTCNSSLNYFAGLRYANLKQDFHAEEDIGVPVGLAQTNTHISFDGFGIGMGLDGMRRAANSGWLVYGRSSASFVSGEFKANYREVTQFGPNSVVGNNLVDYRVITILQTELGLGWQSACGRVRVTTGYQFAGWFNSLTTGSYILGVQNRQFNNLNETITFDGLVTRLQFQF
jgi:Legionella pneumophila major outer membrane protein precursor